MKTKLVACPWMNPKMTEEAQEAIEIIEDEVWKEASILFASEREAKQRVGKTAPKGMQRYLNDTLAKKFTSKGWIGGDGYFFDYITLNVPPRAFSNVPLQIWSL